VPPLPISPEGPEVSEAVVRLSAEVLGRFMGLAGQCVVEASALARIFSRVRDSRRDFLDLAGMLSSLRSTLLGSEAKGRAEDSLVLLNHMIEEHARATRSLDALARRMELTAGRLYAEALATRMRPFGEGVKHLPRLARDLARELGKNAHLELQGTKCRVDRDIMERLEASLAHLVRNAVDHGVESPEERQAAGKPGQGRIVLKARHVSGLLEVRLSDDGRGVSLERLREAVVRKGLAEPDMAARLSARELYEFLFLPGFTTATGLTRVSGRGVGLDVVKTMLQEVGGEARVKSAPGQGTTFILRLPVSRSVVRALVFAVGGEPYALPLSAVSRVAAVPEAAVQSAQGRQYVVMDGVNVGLAAASRILELTPGPMNPEDIPVVVLEGEAGRFGLVVESLLGERDLLVKPLDARLGKVPGVAAASILDDGSPVLILDAQDLARSIERLLEGGRLGRVGGGKGEGRRGPRKVLVADDSLTVREVERQLLAGRGYDVTCAVDGMEALALARGGEFDLIVTDVDMPRMTGIELTRAIKADPALARTPVMIVSYKDRPEDRMAGLAAGADHYLAKSGFSDSALLDAAHDLIGEP
jgi:two-component system sensor histidine kinase and response regulator WspE